MTTRPLSRSMPETLPHAHVVSEAHDLHVLRDGDADGGLHPAADAGLHVLVLPVAGDDLARLAESGSDEAVLAVAVCSLIKVHEVHVDLFVGNLAVILRGKVQPRLLEHIQTVDPHLGRAERMAPRHDTGAGVVKVCFLYDLRDLGAACNRCQNLLAIERLRADNKPECAYRLNAAGRKIL